MHKATRVHKAIQVLLEEQVKRVRRGPLEPQELQVQPDPLALLAS